jgi:hypothetical protein
VLRGEDPATVVVKKKHLWKHQVDVCKDRYKTQKKSKQLHTSVKNISFVVRTLLTSTVHA